MLHSSEPLRASGVAIVVVFGLTGCTTPEPAQQRATDTTVIALNDSQLGDIRGGFDIAPNLSVTFGFQQLTSLDHQIVSSIIVPDFTFSPAALNGADPSGSSSSSGNTSGGGSTNASQAGASGLATNFIQNALSTTNASSGSGSGKSSSVTQTVVPNIPTVTTTVNAGQSATTTVGTQNQGVTTVMTSLGSGGLTNIVGNTANNALVQQVTTINLAISGLQQLLSQHVNSTLLTNALLQSRILPH